MSRYGTKRGRRRKSGHTFQVLWRDDFLTGETAPIVGDPRVAEGGPGYAAIVDTGNHVSINNFGAMTIGGRETNSVDPRIQYSDSAGNPIGVTRANGLALGHFWVFGNTDHVPNFGFSALETPTGASDYENGFRVRAPTKWLSPSYGIHPIMFDAQSGDVCYCATILRSTGAFYCIRPNDEEWKLAHVDESGSTSTLYPTMGVINTGAYPTRLIILSQLPAPFSDAADPLLIFEDPGNVAINAEKDSLVGDFYAHWTDEDATANREVAFRRQDADNYWYVRAGTGGAIRLYKVIGGTPTNVASKTGVITGNETITVIADGDTIQVFYDDIRAINYSGATELSDQTGFKVLTEGISNLDCWYRYISDRSDYAASLLGRLEE